MTKGQRIKKLRTDSGISQTDFAKKVGISKQTLYKYENDIVTNIPSDVIEKIAKTAGSSPEYIMGWNNSDYFATPEDFEKAWKDRGGGRHPIDLTDEEYEFVIEARALHNDNFYPRMKKYWDLFKDMFEKGGDPNA